MDTRPLIDAGLYDPDAPQAKERLELLEYLLECGATLDELVEANAAGALTVVASDLRRRGSEALLTLTELANAAGVSVDQVLAIARTAGLPTPDPDVPGYHPDNVRAFRTVVAGNEMFGEAAILEFTRVMGAALASIADAAMALFGINVAPRLDAEDANELQRARTAELASGMLVEDVPVAMAALFRSHVDAAIRRSTASEGDAAHLAQLAVGFLDLAGSTSMIRALEPDEVAAAMTDFEQCAVELVGSREGRVVKTIGDEVMFVTTTAAAACDVALEVQRMVDEHDVLTAVRGGIAAGALVRGYGDFYGAEVNRAARTVEIAQRGTILVSSAVREGANDDDRFRFVAAGAPVFAGFDEPTEVFRLERAQTDGA